MASSMVLNVQLQHIEGDGLDDGGSVILTFAVCQSTAQHD